MVVGSDGRGVNSEHVSAHALCSLPHGYPRCAVRNLHNCIRQPCLSQLAAGKDPCAQVVGDKVETLDCHWAVELWVPCPDVDNFLVEG